MNAAQLLVRCLEEEGVDYVFGIPGEENIHIMDALAQSRIRFVTTRHEQGAAFMADVYGRLTGRAGVCLATLGPGATNLITGVADANMDRAPLVAIAGQAATTRMHKESHQVLDLAALFGHFTKFSAKVLEPEIVPEVVRKAFKVAQAEKPGASFIEVPENVARMPANGLAPLKVQAAAIPRAPQAKVEQVARLIDEAEAPLVLVGNGAVRQGASGAVVTFIEQLNLPAATTFMAKGAVPFSHPLSLGTIGLQARDPAAFGLDRADLVLCIGYDMVEYDPARWNPQRDKRIVHIDSAPAEVDGHYMLAAGIVGDIADALERIARSATTKPEGTGKRLHASLLDVTRQDADDAAYPLEAATGDRRPAPRHGRRRRAGVRRRCTQVMDRAPVPGGASQHLHHLQRLCRHGHRRAGRDRREARSARAARGRRERRRRLPDELAGARNRRAPGRGHHRAGAARRQIRRDPAPHGYQAGTSLRRRLRQSRLRGLRRELRRAGLPRRARRRSAAGAALEPRRATPRRSSTARSITARTRS